LEPIQTKKDIVTSPFNGDLSSLPNTNISKNKRKADDEDKEKGVKSMIGFNRSKINSKVVPSKTQDVNKVSKGKPKIVQSR